MQPLLFNAKNFYTSILFSPKHRADATTSLIPSLASITIITIIKKSPILLIQNKTPSPIILKIEMLNNSIRSMIIITWNQFLVIARATNKNSTNTPAVSMSKKLKEFAIKTNKSKNGIIKIIYKYHYVHWHYLDKIKPF